MDTPQSAAYPDDLAMRAKGLLRDAAGATWLLQAAGGEVRLTPWGRLARADGLGRVQVIALRALFGGDPVFAAELPLADTGKS